MSYEAYEEILDFPLYYQMRDLVIRSMESTSGGDMKRSFFGEKQPEHTMEERYGLRYPGEALERYQERCGEGRTIMRAIALALADTGEILEQRMFIGGQKEAFLRKLRAIAGKDIYLSGALYTLSEKESERNRLREILLDYPFCSTQEVLYVLSVLCGEHSAWEKLYPSLVSFLGKNRTIKAYRNEGVLSWFLDLFEKEIKECRRKDGEVLKALRELDFHHVRADSKAGIRLKENGYTEQEILYLNMTIPFLSRHKDKLVKNSIVMERIASAGCQSLLNAETLEDKSLFGLCTDTLKKYQSFEIKLEGFKGLKQQLTSRVKIKNADLFCYLYERRNEECLPEQWFHIKIMAESRWDELATRFQEQEYRTLFEECFLAEDMQDADYWLDHYEELTGERYEAIFWREKGSIATMIFERLVLQDKIDIANLFCQYAEDRKRMPEPDCEGKWETMLKYIREAGRKLYCHGIFRLWKELIGTYGIESSIRFMKNAELLEEAVNGGWRWRVSYDYYGYRDSFWQGIDFLDQEESLQVFLWAEEYFYKMKPEYYNDFLCAFTKKKAKELLSAEDGRALMDIVINTLPEKSSDINELRKLFYDPKEWESYQIEEQERKKREEEDTRRNNRKKWQEELMVELANAGTGTKRYILISEKLREVRYGNDDKRKLYWDVVGQELRESDIHSEKKGLVSLTVELLEMVRRDYFDWNVFREIINNMEVLADESTVDETAQ